MKVRVVKRFKTRDKIHYILQKRHLLFRWIWVDIKNKTHYCDICNALNSMDDDMVIENVVEL